MKPETNSERPQAETTTNAAVDAILETVSVPAYKSALAAAHGTTAKDVEQVIRDTAMPRTKDGRPDYTESELAVFLMSAANYRLDPILGQIYALKVKGRFFIFLGKNAWNTIAQRDRNYDGRKYFYLYKHGETVIRSDYPTGLPSLTGVGCEIKKKDRAWPASAVALVAEYRKKVDWTTPYDTQLHTMMEHKAFNKAAQDAFGLGDVYDDLDRDVIDAGNYPQEVYKDEVGPPPDPGKNADRAAPAPARKPAPTDREKQIKRIEGLAVGCGRTLILEDDTDLDALEAELTRALTEGEDAAPEPDERPNLTAQIKDLFSRLGFDGPRQKEFIGDNIREGMTAKNGTIEELTELVTILAVKLAERDAATPPEG